ncbi:MAG: hypothetical protein QF619_01145 [Candidatus Binatia bacterium]|jgi:general secretion pathway protein F|nr:hypothetical protein [Candidatus Binatia bacterium]
MVLFQYRAADHSGKVFEGTMEAEQVVVSQFHAMGCTPLRTAMPGDTPKRAVQIPFGFLSRERITQWELLYFTQELSALLGVGLPLDRGLSVLSDLTEKEKFKGIMRLLLEGVRGGASLCPYLWRSIPKYFPNCT